jgi:AcrR family transcriptional regulator
MDSFPALAPSVPTEAARTRRGKSILGTPTRERILSAAAQLFAEHGFASTSMPTIAERSGITAGAIYRHFSNKAELLLEVVKRALAALPFSFEGDGGKEDAARLPEVAARLTDPALSLVRQLALEVHTAARRDPEVHRLLSAYNETVMQSIRALVEPTLRTGVQDEVRDSEFTARAVMVFLMGLHHMDTLHPQLVGDRTWREFVTTHVATLLGLDTRAGRRKPAVRRRGGGRGANSLRNGEQGPDQ